MEIDYGPRASLDHFIGRKAERVEETPDGWAITLTDGIVISNKDSKRKIPKSVEGKTLFLVTLGELETMVHFGLATPDGHPAEQEVVALSPTQYTIAGLEGQTREFYPQMPEEMASVLDAAPPHPDDRIVEGPQEATGDDLSDEEDEDGTE